ncbi:MAG: hypothetical protein OEX83_06600 [Gammaproteobacteria bacterium]|nr:hypothetical protein [Gammaproteobacteria bacterium]
MRTDIPKIQKIVAILWPSFLMAGFATILFFTAFDPVDMLMTTRFADASRMGAYTVGFFLFWALTASSCMLTCYFQRPCMFKGREASTPQGHTA